MREKYNLRYHTFYVKIGWEANLTNIIINHTRRIIANYEYLIALFQIISIYKSDY